MAQLVPVEPVTRLLSVESWRIIRGVDESRELVIRIGDDARADRAVVWSVSQGEGPNAVRDGAIRCDAARRDAVRGDEVRCGAVLDDAVRAGVIPQYASPGGAFLRDAKELESVLAERSADTDG